MNLKIAIIQSLLGGEKKIKKILHNLNYEHEFPINIQIYE